MSSVKSTVLKIIGRYIQKRTGIFAGSITRSKLNMALEFRQKLLLTESLDKIGSLAEEFRLKNKELVDKHNQSNLNFLTKKVNSISLGEFDTIMQKIKSLAFDKPLTVIPKKIHFVWYGKALPEAYLDNILTFVRSGYVVYIWTDKPIIIYKTLSECVSLARSRINQLQVRDVRDVFLKLEKDARFSPENIRKLKSYVSRECIGFSNYAAASDITRYIVLYTEGGIYFDTDTRSYPKGIKGLPIPAIPELSTHYGFLMPFVKNSSDIIAANSLIASVEYHSLLEIVIKKVLENYALLDKRQSSSGKYVSNDMDRKRYGSMRVILTVACSGPGVLYDAAREYLTKVIGVQLRGAYHFEEFKKIAFVVEDFQCTNFMNIKIVCDGTWHKSENMKMCRPAFDDSELRHSRYL